MRIEIIYAPTTIDQDLRELVVPDGAIVRDAIELSGLLNDYPDIDIRQNGVGIFGRRAELDQELREGDRLEIYRPLIIDPKEARRRRAEKKKDQA